MRLIMRLLAAKWRRGRDSFSPEGSVRVGSDLPPAGHSLPTRSNPTIKKPSHTSCMARPLWRRGRDSNPCGVAPKRFSRPPRYDRFDTSPYMKLSFDRNHQIFNCFRNSFRNALLCCCQSAEKVRCCKAFQGFCDRCARKFSRPPRYDRFDIPPYKRNYETVIRKNMKRKCRMPEIQVLCKAMFILAYFL